MKGLVGNCEKPEIHNQWDSSANQGLADKVYLTKFNISWIYTQEVKKINHMYTKTSEKSNGNKSHLLHVIFYLKYVNLKCEFK